MKNEVRLLFADGEYNFSLAMKHVAELQEKCKAGLFAIYQSFSNGLWNTESIFQTIRLGLIGGGTPATDAYKLCEQYVHGAYIDNLHIAQIVLMSALKKPEVIKEKESDDDAEKTEPAENPPPTG